ncbi:hypothetical protein MNEG_12663, partial [Monoraphidium neglectum]
VPFCLPPDLNRGTIAALEELLGPENAPSLGRLKRRLGILPAPPRAPRVVVPIPHHPRRVAV